MYIEALVIKNASGTIVDVTGSNALKVDNSGVTQPCSIASLPLPTGAATSALQTTCNTTLSTIDTSVNSLLKPASTLAAVTTLGTITNVVHIDDNAGSITIDNSYLDTALSTINTTIGTLLKPANTLTKVTTVDTITNPVAVTGTFWQATQPVSGTVAFSNTTIEVTNTGTFACQATIGAGVALIGKVGIDQTTPGTTNKVSLGSDVVHTIVDSGAITVSGTCTATLSAETTKVIGTVRTADGSGNLYTTNSTTYTAKFGQDTNLLGTLGTAFTTAGFVDIKAADGNVFVRQATASNLNATVVGTGTFVCQATLAAETTKVIGTVNISAAQTIATVTAVTAITNALPAGTNAIGKLAANTGVDIGDVDVTSVVPGTGATNLGKAEDAVHNTGDTGLFVLGVANQAGTALVNADGDYTPYAVDKMGQIYINPDNIKLIYRGRSGSFRNPGIAGTAGQKLIAIHNATGSTITVRVKRIIIDMYATVVKAITVAPPIVRIWAFTAVPTNGTAMTKSKIGGTGATSSSVTVWNGASADGTSSGTALTITLPAGTIVDQQFPERIITGAGTVGGAQMIFEYPNGIDLPALTGLAVFLDYATATFNPITDQWVASLEWEEFTT